jgi:hypothetical protein
MSFSKSLKDKSREVRECLFFVQSKSGLHNQIDSISSMSFDFECRNFVSQIFLVTIGNKELLKMSFRLRSTTKSAVIKQDSEPYF